MSQPLKIAYLEISPRMTGKTSRLRRMAIDIAVQGKQVVFVCSPGLYDFLRFKLVGVCVVRDGDPVPDEINADTAVWFYDEFDWLKTTQLRAGAYYSTTASRQRDPDRDTPSNDLLLRLIEVHGNHYQRFLWPFEMHHLDLAAVRKTMSPAQFRLNYLGEFIQ
jgi:hypothetical protein